MSKKNNNSKLFEEFYIINADALDQTSSEINAALANPTCNLEGFLSKLEGFKTRCKNLHWAAPKNDVHVRLDEFLDYIDAFEDSIAEGTMGIIGKIGPNSVNGEQCDATNAQELAECIKSATVDFYNTLPQETCWKGISSEVETFIQNINKYTYLFSITDFR